ncbi:MAG: class F sortase, partial [Clostridiales bacterium]|nr:class F sortase [Clostridiales bacterium]
APAVTPTPIATAPAPDSTDTNAGLNATAAPDLNATPVPVPVMIYFDAHKQKAVIEVVGIGEGNVMGSIDDPYKAGWFYYGASPGEAGNAIINGHQRFNKKKGIFSVLKNSKPGESVRIDFNEGFTRYFEIESIESYLAQDIPEEIIKVGKDTPTRLILITCLGDYDFTGQSMSRVVVICKEQTQLRQENDTRPIPGPVKE